MNINWFTVIAQVINFLILVWLMKRFLYKPVLNAIDEREKKIAGQLADAETQKNEAAKEHADFKQKNEHFEGEKKELMDKVIADAGVERKKLMESVKSDAEILRKKQEDLMRESQESMNREIAQRALSEVFAVSRKVLTDISSVSLEEQSVNLFLKRLSELNKEERRRLMDVFKSGGKMVLIQSAFPLTNEQQKNIESAINGIVGMETRFQYKTMPELISGIELSANGFKLSWSISDYLNSMVKDISAIVSKEVGDVATEQNMKTNGVPEKI